MNTQNNFRYSWSYLLFFVVVIQFFAINCLLTKLSSQDINNVTQIPIFGKVNVHTDNDHFDLSKSAPILNKKTFEQKQSLPDEMQLNENANISPKTAYYQGVSTTLMLNSPKWFQRRYTAMVSNILLNTPSDWAVQIFYIDSGQSQFGLDINPGLTRLSNMAPYSHRFIFTKLPSDIIEKHGLRKKKLYWTDPWLWENMVADRVLVFGGNGALCSNSNRSLADRTAMDGLLDRFDYIGTPWTKMNGQGGDGSISYRNRTAMLDAIRFKTYDGHQTDDLYFITALAGMNKLAKTADRYRYRIATKEQTHLFGGAAEDFMETSGAPMILSGTLDKLDHESREVILFLCPELKVIFPALHNPNCFGAHPNATECARHICALKDPKIKSGGC